MGKDILDGCGVYAIRNVVNGKSYVGSSINLSRRLRIHRWNLRRGTHHSKKLQRAWNKHGESSFIFELLELVSDPRILLSTEQRHLDSTDTFKHGYNMAKVAGSPMLGRIHTDEAKRKISSAFKGVPKKSPLTAKGSKIPRETVEKIAAANRGQKRSPETRKRISDACKGNAKWLGKKHSPESIEKQKAAHQARWAKKRAENLAMLAKAA